MKDYSDTSNFSFNLDWDELPEDLREQKIDEYLEKIYPDFFDTDEPPMTLEQFQEEQDNRETAEEHIKVHFPIYF